jgi:hypothetical protein
MRNLTRAQEEGTSPVPTIAYSVYKKKFEAPDESEGFALVIV